MQEEIMIPKHRFDEVNEERKKLEQEICVLRETAKEAEKLREENNKLKIDSVVDRALAEANAINPATVKPLLQFPEDCGDIYGVVKEQVGRLAADSETAFLFKSQEKPAFKGCVPDEGCDGFSGEHVQGLDAAIAKHILNERI